MGTSANADGYYRLDNIIEGTYEVVVSVLGYRKFREELTISPGLNRFDASLIPSSVQLEQVIVTASMKESFTRITCQGGGAYPKIFTKSGFC